MTQLTKRIGLTAALFLGLMALTMQAQEEDISYAFTLDYPSKYIWRGQDLLNGAALQPGISVGYMGFSAGVWGNYDLNQGLVEDFSEIDYAISYGGSIGDTPLGYEVGFIYYAFPFASDTYEVYGSLSYDTVLAPTLTWYQDLYAVDSYYVSFGIGHSIPLENVSEKLSVELSSAIAWAGKKYNNGYFGVDDSGLNDWTTSAGLNYAATDNFSVYAALNYSEIMDKDIRAGATTSYGDSANTWVGMGFALEF